MGKDERPQGPTDPPTPPKGPESKASRRKLRGVALELEALEYRKAGLQYRRIGELLGVNESAAWKAVMRGLARLKEKVAEKAGDVRELEIRRLDDMLLAIWAQVKRGNVLAIDRALRICERISRLGGIGGLTPSEAEAVGKGAAAYVEAVIAAEEARRARESGEAPAGDGPSAEVPGGKESEEEEPVRRGEPNDADAWIP